MLLNLLGGLTYHRTNWQKSQKVPNIEFDFNVSVRHFCWQHIHWSRIQCWVLICTLWKGLIILILKLGFDLSVHLCWKPDMEIEFNVCYFLWYLSIRILVILSINLELYRTWSELLVASHSLGSVFNYFFPSALTRLSEKVLGFIFFPAVRFEPGTAGYEVRTLPLCYAS